MSESQYEKYKRAITRIYCKDGYVVGSGLLVSSEHILTCAHVVADALNIDRATKKEDLLQNNYVELDFPFPPAPQKQKVIAKVVFWEPTSDRSQYGKDIAGLKLEEELSEDNFPIGLTLAGFPMNRFQIFGFPSGNDPGIWTLGEFRDERADGWVQMVVKHQSDYFVEGGFSGAPVWDDNFQGVAGIVVAAELNEDNERRKQVKAAFMIPTKVLAQTWCELKSYIVNTNQNLVEKSTHQKVADLLFHLNYKDEEEKFKEVIESRSEAAFLIRAREERIQRWLVRRLAGCVPGFQTAKRYEIRIRSHPMRSDFDAFWSEFERDLGKNLNREKVIQGLAKLSQYQSIIIAIRGFSSLDKEKMPQLFTFWSDLVNQVRSIPQPQRFFRARLVLLLAEGNSSKVVDRMNPVKCVESTVVGEAKYPILLEPLEKILQTDVQTWLTQETVYSSLNRTDEEMQSIVRNDISSWDEEPSQILEEICQTILKIKDGIAAIEPYWKLVL